MKSDKSDHLISRWNALKSSAALLGGGLVASDYAGANIKNVNTKPSPSKLKTTAQRVYPLTPVAFPPGNLKS
ncbi:MAG: hypothetical protein P8Z30_04835 [Acidobacteriota bacterium]